MYNVTKFAVRDKERTSFARNIDTLAHVFRFRSRSINKFHRQKAFVYTKFSSDNNVSYTCLTLYIVVSKRYSLTFTFAQNETQIECDSDSGISVEMEIILLLQNANYYIYLFMLTQK